MSGGWYWNKNNLNTIADKDDILTITKRINGVLLVLNLGRKFLQKSRKLCNTYY